MKKTLIAGVASAALATMPIAGVFAISVTDGGTLTDNFEVTIAHSCTMTRQSTPHANGYNSTTWSTDTSDDTLDIMNIGAITSGAVYSLGASNFNVKCNGNSGYEVKSVITNFTNHAGDEITLGTSEITTAPTTASVWTVYNGSSYISTNAATIVKSKGSATANAGDNFTMTYKLGLKDGQASGTYTGNVAYTLYDLTE